MLYISAVPEIKWDEPEVTIPEGDGRLVCFTTSIGSVAPYQIMVGVRGKGDPAAMLCKYMATERVYSKKST